MKNYRRTLVCTTMMDDPFATRPGLPDATRWLVESANRHGIEVEVIGQGMPFENWWVSKCVRLFEAVAGRQEFDHIVFVDGTDTLFAAGLEELHAAFETYAPADFVVAGEDICWPYRELGDSPSFDQSQKFRYPNSGFWMGTWPAFLREFNALFAMPHTDRQRDHQTIYNCDQGRYELGIADGTLHMAVDVDRRLSLALHYLGDRAGTDPEIEWSPRPRILATDVRPCTLHCNGYAKQTLPKIRELLQG